MLLGAATVLLGLLALVLLWGSRGAGPATDAAAGRAETAKAVVPKKGVTHHKAAPRVSAHSPCMCAPAYLQMLAPGNEQLEHAAIQA